jgi:4-hydroxy-3-methylbut-2-enyl diphosphate reductase
MLQIILCEPRGFCAGVERAIEIVERALQKYGAPIYVRHEIVHNRWVVDDLKSRGVIFVDDVSDIPDGAWTVFSAHGVSEAVEMSAKARNLPMIDATCPLVTKVHLEAQRYEREGQQIILIGHAGHPEVEGTSGRVKQDVLLVSNVDDVAKLVVQDSEHLAYVTQTTLSVDDTRVIIAALKERFPAIIGPDVKDICYATQNRQNAIKDLAGKVDMLLVIGATNSSNSSRLRDLGEEMGIASYLIADAKELQKSWLDGRHAVGISAGASAPEHLVQGVVEQIQAWIPEHHITTHISAKENVHFKLPEQVRD